MLWQHDAYLLMKEDIAVSFLFYTMDNACFNAQLHAALHLVEAFHSHLMLFQTIPYKVIVTANLYGFSMKNVNNATRASSTKFCKQTFEA